MGLKCIRGSEGDENGRQFMSPTGFEEGYVPFRGGKRENGRVGPSSFFALSVSRNSLPSQVPPLQSLKLFQQAQDSSGRLAAKKP